MKRFSEFRPSGLICLRASSTEASEKKVKKSARWFLGFVIMARGGRSVLWSCPSEKFIHFAQPDTFPDFFLNFWTEPTLDVIAFPFYALVCPIGDYCLC